MKSLKTLTTLAGTAAIAWTAWTYSAPVAAQTATATPPAVQSAAAVDPALYSGMQWRSLGPARGGRSIAVGGSEARPNEYWFGATGGGAWKTTDGGSNWAPMTDGKISTSSVGSLAVCQSNPDVVYIGGGETQFRGNIIQGDGIYKTTDGGKTWTHLPQLRESQAIARIRLHPSNCDIVYAAVFGQVYNDHPERGIFKSTDGGQTFKKTLYRDEKTPAVDLSIDAKNPNVIYAGLWEANRSPWGMSSGGPGSGLFKSTDGGDNWTEITKAPGLPAGLWGKVGVSVSPVDGNRVYAIIENEKGGLYVSDDAGASWKLINENRNLRQRAFYYTRVLADTEGQGHRLRPQRAVPQVHRRREDHHDHPRAARRQSRSVDLGHGQPAHGAVERRRRQRDRQRRPDLDLAGLPDRAVLQRVHDEARAVSRVRRAAGQLHGLRRQPGQPGSRGGQSPADLLRGGWR